jgi:hypothetical protein
MINDMAEIKKPTSVEEIIEIQFKAIESCQKRFYMIFFSNSAGF